MKADGYEIETENHKACRFLIEKEGGESLCHVRGVDDFKPDAPYKTTYCIASYWQCSRYKKANSEDAGEIKHLHDV